MSLLPRKNIRKRNDPGRPADQKQTLTETQAVPTATEAGPERLTANEWAKKHNFNEVAAERAAMRAGKWHDVFTESEFFELIKGRDI